MDKYHVSIIIQGSLRAINQFIDFSNQDNSLVLYSTWIQNIIDTEQVMFSKIEEKDAIKFGEKLMASIEITTDIRTVDIKRLHAAIKQDMATINRFFVTYANEELDVLIASKKLKFTEDNYSFI